ncbi:MAG TPA: hypothetical protein VF669_17835 [Tepidisphaeraceae bacterium]|jgi:hypothetical protein
MLVRLIVSIGDMSGGVTGPVRSISQAPRVVPGHGRVVLTTVNS